MITTVGRGTPEPVPRLTPQGAGAPQFAVQFSRPRAVSGRPDSRSNTFRWIGPGTIHVLERGLLVLTRRRSPLGIRTTDERFVPASDIFEVFRDGDAVRVDLRGESGTAEFFQFWTGNPATAGTIVRLLPTTRTIEYEIAPADAVATPRAPLTLQRRRRAQRRFWQAALTLGLLAVTALLITDIAMRKADRLVPQTVTVPIPVPQTHPAATPTRPVPHATPAELASALAELRRFDDRMEGLRTQYRSASDALQSGHLSQIDFSNGIERWLIPQWRAMYEELDASQHVDGSLIALIRFQLMNAATDWKQALHDYTAGLEGQSYGAVMAAFDRMSNGNEARREAWRLLESAELESAASASLPRRP